MAAHTGTVTLFELEILSGLGRHRSLRSLGREKRLEAPHLSKILARLEAKLGATLIQRSPQGFILTPEGLRLVRLAREMLVLSEGLAGAESDELDDSPSWVSLAAPRFVAANLVAPALEQVRSANPRLRFRLLDMAPDEVVSAALRSACDVVVTVGQPQLTRTWETTRLGNLTWGLFASRRHPLPEFVPEEKLAPYPFLVPTYWKGDRFETGDDYCPIPWRKRHKGDESSSIITAVELLKESPDQLVFAPRVVMQPFVSAHRIREIRVRGWERVEKPIYLSVRADRVSKKLEKSLGASLAGKLD